MRATPMSLRKPKAPQPANLESQASEGSSLSSDRRGEIAFQFRLSGKRPQTSIPVPIERIGEEKKNAPKLLSC